MTRMSVDWLLAVLLACNVAQGFAAPQLEDRHKFCLNKVTLNPSMTCQQVADLCRTSLTNLFKINPYFQNGAVCNRPLDRSVTVCCDLNAVTPVSIGNFAVTGVSDPCQRECLPEVNEPVCGSDGQTYRNQCFLEVESCRNPFKQLFVFAYTECQTDAWVKCREVCPAIVQPVCGSNNKTYMNDCYLRVAACFHPNQQITKVSNSACQRSERNSQTLEVLVGAGAVAGLFAGTQIGTKFPSCFALSGEECIFPFSHEGAIYFRCSTENFLFRWCATEVVNGNMVKWGKCAFGC